MTTTLLACLALAAGTPAELFQEAENLSRGNQNAEAMAKVEQAVEQLERAHAAGEKLEWQEMNGLIFAARLAREDFLDHDKAMAFCRKLFDFADNDYWKVPARLEMALTYRAQGKFKEAQQQYDAIAAADERQRSRMLVPQAEMVLVEMDNREKGQALLEAALLNEAINGRERFGALRKSAQRAMAKGRQDEALRWYAMLEKLPFEKPEDRARFLSEAWYEMGKIEESRGRTAEAKAHYRRAMELEDGEMRYRTRARDALESIEYFE